MKEQIDIRKKRPLEEKYEQPNRQAWHMSSNKSQKRKKYRFILGMKKKNRERESSKQGFYISCLKIQIYPLLGKAKELYASRFYQLKIVHGVIETFLEQIERVESAGYWCCGETERSVIHFVTTELMAYPKARIINEWSS